MLGIPLSEPLYTPLKNLDMKLLVDPYNTAEDAELLASKSNLTAEKVHHYLIENLLYFEPLEDFYPIWEELLLGIIIYKPRTIGATLIPFL